jgi:hypothetical protein
MRAVTWAAREPNRLLVHAPMCVQASYFIQTDAEGQRLVVHFFNGLNTTAHHGLPQNDVPLREEHVPIHDMRLRLPVGKWGRLHWQPGNSAVPVTREGDELIVDLPPLSIHAMLVCEM